MPRAKNIAYRAGAYDAVPYLSVKMNGRYAYIGEAPKLDYEMIALLIEDLEDGQDEILASWGWKTNELPLRIYEALHKEDATKLQSLGLSRSDLVVLANFAFYPDSYEAHKNVELVSDIMRQAIREPVLVEQLDAKYWNNKVVVDTGKILIPIPPLKQDDHFIWMLDAIINDGKRYPRSKLRF